MKATDSRECRNCHSFETMALEEQDKSAQKRHSPERQAEKNENLHRLPQGNRSRITRRLWRRVNNAHHYNEPRYLRPLALVYCTICEPTVLPVWLQNWCASVLLKAGKIVDQVLYICFVEFLVFLFHFLRHGAFIRGKSLKLLPDIRRPLSRMRCAFFRLRHIPPLELVRRIAAEEPDCHYYQ